MNEDQLVLKCDFDERTTRAISSAIDFTLEKWAGGGDLDQEMLIQMRSAFHSMILEFNFNRDMSS